MKKMIFTLLLAAAMLAGCMRELDESRLPERTNEVPEETASETEATVVLTEAETDAPQSPYKTVEIPEIVLPEIVYSIRDVDLELIPEGLEFSEDLTEAIACAIYEQTCDPDFTARVTSIIDPKVSGQEYFYVYFELYPKGAVFCPDNLLNASMNAKIVRGENGDYIPDEQYINPTTISSLKRNKQHIESILAEPGKFDFLYLDSDNRICISHSGTSFTTDLYYKGNIGSLSESCIIKWDGDTGILLSCEDKGYSSPYRITVSRDGGETWHTTYPQLEPLGKDGQHAELGFTASRIQFMDDEQIYIFIGTNLASMTVLTVEAGENEAAVLFRQQIGGYETTSLVDAAMVNENRGFYTLAHPKYAASNAIYRTTDGGSSWIRCAVPMPEKCTTPWEMRLYLPYQPEGVGKSVWYMEGEWDTGRCTYISEDGGWTWAISE